MKPNPLSELYEQVLLNEAEKHALQNPKSAVAGNLKNDQDIFGEVPKTIKDQGPEKAKLQKGPSYKETTGSTTSAPKASKGSGPKDEPAKSPKMSAGKEMKGTDVDPTDEEDSDKKEKGYSKEDVKPFLKKKEKQSANENIMSAFETLFKKTLMEEVEEDTTPTAEEELPAEEEMEESVEGEDEGAEEELEQEEGDLISDLKDLQDKLASILDKLQSIQDEEEGMEASEGDEDFSDEDYDSEFGDEDEDGEGPMRESLEKPKPLGDKKKVLQNKQNKVGKLTAKRGKAHGGNLKHEPKPKALGDKKKVLQGKSNQVRSSLKKGDFIK